MNEVKTGPNPLFLRQEELRFGMEVLLCASREVMGEAEGVLACLDIGPAQLRLLSLVRSRPRISVSEALSILGITKQSLSRILSPLLDRSLLVQHRGLRDGRQRLLELTDKGHDVERQLTEAQLHRIARAYRDAGAEAVEGFRKVMLNMLDKPEREFFLKESALSQAVPGRPR